MRARQHRRKDRDGDQVLPVLIHGDAAFAGQGVVMETLNLSQTRGYGTGGTVHIVVNNQIGFTTSDPRDTRSTLYCTDVVKMIEAPIFHVNGDDPEAVVLATEIALDFRMEFKKDVVIDLVCFRKLGHNEQDEPMVTQPLMYKIINAHPGTRKLYADRLAAQGVIAADEADQMVKDLPPGAGRRLPHQQDDPLQLQAAVRGRLDEVQGHRSGTSSDDTTLPLADLQMLAERLTTIPPDFKLHPRVEKIIADRAPDGRRASCRSTGAWPRTSPTPRCSRTATRCASPARTAGRGTFFHRHAVLHDQNREKWDAGTYIPLAAHRGQPGRLRRHRLGAVRGGGARLRVRLLDLASRTSW